MPCFTVMSTKELMIYYLLFLIDLLLILTVDGSPFQRLPSPSATKNTGSPTLATTEPPKPSSLPEGVYHNPFPLQTPMHDLPEALVGLWQQGISMDLIVYVNQNEYFTDYHLHPSCHVQRLILGQFFDPRVQKLMIPLTNVRLWTLILDA